MPCATVHLLVARESLAHWERSATRPFDLTEANRAAFLHGSLAPDVGFIPGVDRFVSELAHYHRPADLCRALVDRATSQEDLAFSWGWVAHVLGDVALHPMVGRAVGEQLHGDRSRRMNAAEHLPAHVAMEVGLDIVLLTSHHDIPAPPATAYFDSKSITLLARALEAVYGIPWSLDGLLRDHRTAVSRTRRWPLALRTLRTLANGWRSPVLAPVAAFGLAPFRLASGPDSAMRGFLEPRRPPHWLVDSIQRGATRISRDLDRLTQTDLGPLQNRNLETGQPHEAEDPHLGAVNVRRKLVRARRKAGLAASSSTYDDRATVVARSEPGRRIGRA